MHWGERGFRMVCDTMKFFIKRTTFLRSSPAEARARPRLTRVDRLYANKQSALLIQSVAWKLLTQQVLFY